MTATDTPRTDASLIEREAFCPEELLKCSRELERELSDAKQEVERLRAIIDAMNLTVQATLNPTEK
jgi:hypothetical protein